LRVLWVKSGGLVPLDTGGKIRSFNLFKELARRCELDLFTFYAKHDGDAHAELKQYCHGVHCVPLEIPEKNSASDLLHYAINLPSLQPYSMAKYCRPEVGVQLRQHLAKHSYDVILCDFLLTAAVIPWENKTPKVLFTHNVEAQIWERHYKVSRNPVWKAISWREFRTLDRFEKNCIQQSDHVLTVSETDKDIFAKTILPKKITVIPTGVDLDFFQPGTKTDEQADSMVFTGSMDWTPNEDAILFFAEQILPRIRTEIPAAQLWVVGRSPSSKLQALAAANNGVNITGRVDDIRPYVHRSPVYVVPLRIGGGTRIKIFEAMAMGKAVVSTTIGAEGLPIHHEKDLILADEPGEFARRVISLMRNPAERDSLGRAARLLVEEKYGWAAAANTLYETLVRAAENSKEKLSRNEFSQPPAVPAGASSR
jgi:sugar transferase (PEP-CTERM/EpsH1 system associated)